MTLKRKNLFATTMFVGMATATLAFAQPAPPDPNQSPVTPAPGQTASEAEAARSAASNDEGTEVRELVITGSHIRSTEFTSSSPIQVVTSEQSVLEGIVDTATLLQEQPIASGSFQVNGLLTGFVTSGGPGAFTISLRGLGAQRTLVLLDGKRLGPAGVRGQVGPVDLNVIPDAILERTEILKDGASSIYGSDAVAGVVNFITKTNLDGGRLSVFGNFPTHQGGEQFEVNGAWGKTFDRGFFSISGDFTKQYELRYGDRETTRCAEAYVVDPTTGQRADYIDPRTNQIKCYNSFTNLAIDATGTFGGVFQYAVPGITYPTSAQGNNIDVIFPTLAGTFVRAGRAGRPITQPYENDDTPGYYRQSAVSPYERYTLYSAGSYDLSPAVELYGNFLFNRRVSHHHGLQQFFSTVAAGNPNNPFIDGAGDPNVNNWFDFLFVAPQQSDTDVAVNYYRGVAGLKGKLGSNTGFLSNWSWDLYGEVSRSRARYTTDIAYADRVLATTLPGAACYQFIIDTSPSVPCMSIPYFSQHFLAGNYTDAERAFLFAKVTGHTAYDQEMVEGSLSGDLFELPAGAVAVAVGGTYRHEKIDDTPDPQEVASNLYNRSSAGITRGSDTVWEAWGEAHVPLIRGTPGFEKLELEASGRWTHYDSYGGNGTYKLGLNWQVIPAVRFRGTYGTSFRAPALYELFLADQTSFLNQTSVDPCIHPELLTNTTIQANCFAAGVPIGYAGGGSGVTITTGGGIGRLKAETSKAGTIGVILTPSWLDISVAVDYFDIRVKNQVRQFGARNIITQCFRATDFPNDPFCDFFTRDPVTHGIINVEDNYVNVANEISRGLDLTARFKHDFPFGKLTIDAQMTWQFEDTTQLLGASDPEDFNGSTTEPDWTGQLQVRFDKGDWTFFWDVDAYGKASDTDLSGFNFTDIHPSNKFALNLAGPRNLYYKQYTEFTAYHSASIRYRAPTWSATVGVQNLFDEPPPALSENEGFRVGIAALNAYDLLGRRVFVQIDKKF